MHRRFTRNTASLPGTIAFAILFSFAVPSISGLSHVVGPDDTLYGLSRQYEIPVAWILVVNGLEDSLIRPGQKLEIPMNGPREAVVRPGDTLSALSLLLDIPVEEIMRANDMTDTRIREGQVLTLPAWSRDGYVVRSGDTLSAIARRYQIDESELQKINGLTGDLIRPGMVLVVEVPRSEEYQVREGDSLWSIAVDRGVTVDQIALWNTLDDSVIRPGDVLTLYDGGGAPGENRHVALASYPRVAPESTSGLPRDGEYFWNAPGREAQPDAAYAEEPENGTLEDFRRAIKVITELDDAIDALPPVSRQLKGWRIVIDPGHGGKDPGAIVSVEDGDGHPLAVTEDEYAYDIALRLYRILRLHGAEAYLTILSPDHHIRDGENPRATFVHRKNEVYADAGYNRSADSWRPVGTTDGLERRKEIAARRLRGSKDRQTLYISIHADNTPDLPAGTALLFDGETDTEIENSRALAATLAPHMGAGSFIRRQSLRVLRENPADAAVLVEARNIAYQRNSWAIRVPELREQDAAMIARGILDWASGVRR